MTKQLRNAGAVAAMCVTLLAGREPGPAVNTSWNGVAIHGFDAVAYFTDHKPVKGVAAYSYRWMNAEWRFSSGEHRDRFAAAPEKFAPQYGGFCAWAVGHNHTADIDPEAWSIVDGKLYLNYDRGVQSKWEQDRRRWIDAADRNWPALHSSSPR